MNEIVDMFHELQQWDATGIYHQLINFSIWLALIIFFIWIIRLAINRSVHDNTMRYRAKKITMFAGYVLIFLLAIITFTGNVKYFSITIRYGKLMLKDHSLLKTLNFKNTFKQNVLSIDFC